MTNRQLYDRVERLREVLAQQLKTLEAISTELEQVIEENHKLTMENVHLKERLDALAESPKPLDTTDVKSSKTKKRSQSLINLENIYDQGFHICNVYYGKRRENDENCMFCTEILFGERDQ